MQSYGDNFIPIIPVDFPLHTPELPFCYDESCGCHEDGLLIAEVAQHVRDGLFTPQEATDFVSGRTI